MTKISPIRRGMLLSLAFFDDYVTVTVVVAVNLVKLQAHMLSRLLHGRHPVLHLVLVGSRAGHLR